MKYLFFLILLLFLFRNSFAQSQSNEFKVESSQLKVDANFTQLSNVKLETCNFQIPKAYKDTIWFEDFDSTRWSTYGIGEGPEGWQFQDNNEMSYYWGWSDHGPRGAYTSPNNDDIKENQEPQNRPLEYLDEIGATSFNGIMMIESDWFNTGEDGNILDDYISMDSWVQTPYIDVSEFDEIQFSYNQMYRACCGGEGKFGIFVSADYNEDYPESEHWTEFDGWGYAPQVSEHTTVENRNLTFNLSFLEGADSIVIRFHKSLLSHYYWLIDDIIVSVPSAYNLKMERAWWDYGHYPNIELEDYDPDLDWYGGYTVICPDQVQDFVSFRAAVTNMGYMNQENVRLNVIVTKDEVEIYNETSSGVNLGIAEKDTLILDTGFRLNGVGEYMISSTVISDNIEQIPSDNFKSYDFKVTSGKMSRVYDPPYVDRTMTGAWVSGGNPGDALLVKYEIVDDTEVESISTFLWKNDDEEQINDILNGNFNIIARLYKTDDNSHLQILNPIISSELYEIQLSDTMSWITLDFIKDGESEFIVPGVYYVGIEFYKSSIDIDIEIANETRILQPQDNVYAIFNGELAEIQDNPVINLDINNDPSKVEFYFPNLQQILGDTLYITGSFFNPEWPEPGTLEGAKMTLDDYWHYFETFLYSGIYYFNIYLGTGWENPIFDTPLDIYIDNPSPVQWRYYVNVNENDSKNHIQVFPNPVNDLLNIIGIDELRVIKIYNLLGKEFRVNASQNGKTTSIHVAHLPPGIYFLKINNETHKIIINR